MSSVSPMRLKGKAVLESDGLEGIGNDDDIKKVPINEMFMMMRGNQRGMANGELLPIYN